MPPRPKPVPSDGKPAGGDRPAGAAYPADPEVIAALRRFVALDRPGEPPPGVERSREVLRVRVEVGEAPRSPYSRLCALALLRRFGLRGIDSGGTLLPAATEGGAGWVPILDGGSAWPDVPGWERLRAVGARAVAAGESPRVALGFRRVDLEGVTSAVLAGPPGGSWLLPGGLDDRDVDRLGALFALEGWRLAPAGGATSPWHPGSAWESLLGEAPASEASGVSRVVERLRDEERDGRRGIVLLWPGGGREDSASLRLWSRLEEEGVPLRRLWRSAPDERSIPPSPFDPAPVLPEVLGEMVGLAGAPADRFVLLRRIAALGSPGGGVPSFRRRLVATLETPAAREWWAGGRSAEEVEPTGDRQSPPVDPSMRALARAAARPPGLPPGALPDGIGALPPGFAVVDGRIRWLGESPAEAPTELDRSLGRFLADAAADPGERIGWLVTAGEAERAFDELPAAALDPRLLARLAEEVARDPSLPPSVRDAALERAARAALDGGDPVRATELLGSAGSADRELPRERRLLFARAAWARRDVAEAASRLAPERAEPAPDSAALVGAVLRASGDGEGARDFLEAAIAAGERAGWAAAVLVDLAARAADLSAERGEGDRSARWSAEVERWRPADLGAEAAAELERRLGYVRFHSGDSAGAAEAFERALEIARGGGLPRLEAELLADCGVLARARGDRAAARRCWVRAASLQRERGGEAARLGLLNNLAVLALEEGELSEARDALGESIPGLERLGLRHSLLFDLATDAQLALVEGELDRVASRLRVLLGADGAGHPARGIGLLAAAELALLRGEKVEALERLRTLARSDADLRGDEPRQRLLARCLGRVDGPIADGELPRPLALEMSLAAALSVGGTEPAARNELRSRWPHRLPAFVRLAAASFGEESVAAADPALVSGAFEAAERLGLVAQLRALRRLARSGGAPSDASRAALARLVADPEAILGPDSDELRREAGLPDGPLRIRWGGDRRFAPAGADAWCALREEEGDRPGVDLDRSRFPVDGEGLRSLLLALVDRAPIERGGAREVDEGHEELAGFAREHGIVTTGPPLAEVLRLGRRLATNDVPVAIHGESGTGKELVARLLHDAGPRRRAPFVAFNVASVPESLVEGELFGAARGSYTGADRDRPGLFEAAHRGTLFLDEVAEMPPTVQAKLLRVLQEGEVRRLGETAPRKIDVRVVSASHRRLEEEVSAERFREDLYYRLAVVTISLPPLRERGDDLSLLLETALANLAREAGRGPFVLAADARRRLLRHPWPGNVRELFHVLRAAVALAPGNRIATAHLPALTRADARAPRGERLGDRLQETRRREIEEALRRTGGVVAHAAARLGVTRQAVHLELRRLGIDPARYRVGARSRGDGGHS